MDAVTAFLNAPVDEEIYLEQPDGFVEGTNKVWMIKKAIYGLKQSPKMWNEDVNDFLVSIRFHQSPCDACLYLRQKDSEYSLLYIHVDDMIITGNNIERVKTEIKNKWEMEDLGIAKSIVGIQLKKTPLGYSINQRHMAPHILKTFNHEEAKIAATPLPITCSYTTATDEEYEAFKKLNLPYRNGVCSLLYLAQCTRPDLSQAVGLLARFMDKPSIIHWKGFCHVLRYLKGTTNYGIEYTPNEEKLNADQSYYIPHGHSDADWAGDKST